MYILIQFTRKNKKGAIALTNQERLGYPDIFHDLSDCFMVIEIL